MKAKLFSFFVGVMMACPLFSTPQVIPTVSNIESAYDVSNNVVLCLYFGKGTCFDVYLISSSNNWGGGTTYTNDWSNCNKFMPLPNFEGWFVVVIPYESGLSGIPIQSPSDGTWSWDYICGDKNAWIHYGGNAAIITDSYVDECNVEYPSPGVYIYEMTYWKKHRSPCPSLIINSNPLYSGYGQIISQTIGVTTFEAVSNYGYHFAQWSDGNNANPRSIELTKDTSFIAVFAPNKYSINVTCDENYGYIVGENGNLNYLTTHQYEAIANYGYHFVKWSDGVTRNPRSLTVEHDSIITASFARNKYRIQDGSNSVRGHINGTGSFDYLSEHKINAIANHGYHFVQWSDGDTNNPRTIILTQDTIFAAEFEPNQYSVTVSCDTIYGNIVGENGYFDYMTNHIFEAVSNYGYHFVQWSDGNAENPRDLLIEDSISITAIFAKNIYVIIDSTNVQCGYIEGAQGYEYLDTAKITAVPHYGYYFTQWSDGEEENVRTLVVMQDTAFAAEFVPVKSGTCGDNNDLTWSYEDKTKTLTITGNGALTENYTFGVEAPTQMQNLIIGNEVTSIGDSAFYSTQNINHLAIGGNVASIGDYAFAECKNFDDITCYATTVPTINATTFANIGNKQYIYLYVPENRERAYKRDVYWGEFDIQILGADETTTDGSVTVVPADNTVEITWPSVDNAETYEIVITKDGEVICTLIFNANGQLAGIAFAPGRNGSNHTQQAQTAGFKFTVTGLTGNTTYNYAVASKDNTGNIIDTKSGSFTTTGGEQGLEDSVIETQNANKLLRDGQILILRGDKTYTLQGQEVK